MLSAGVNINYREGYEGSPVLCAAIQNHFEMVQFLVERGADLSYDNIFMADKKTNSEEEKKIWIFIMSY